jgi:iron complex outermembrane receptor protein
MGDLNVRASHVTGKDNIQVGGAPSTYDYKVSDLNAEYQIKIKKWANVVPGLNLQNASFDDRNYLGETGEAFLNGTQQSLSTISGFIRTDINISPRWRVVAAIRADKFSSPDDLYLAYELASTLTLGDNHLIRLATTRSNSGAFIGYNKLNLISRDGFHAGGPLYMDLLQKGNESLELLTVNSLEVGYRARLSPNFQLDIDVFRQAISNLTTTIIRGFTQYPPSPASDFLIEFDNVPTTASQVGTTIGINFVPNGQWQVKPFITLQTTETRDLPDSYVDPRLSSTQPGMGFPQVTYSDSRHEYTPAAYGGLYANYKPHEKLNVNLNGYVMSNQTWYSESGPTVNRGSTILVNARINYSLTRHLNVYVNGRNLINQKTPQFLGGDYLGALYSGGILLELN